MKLNRRDFLKRSACATIATMASGRLVPASTERTSPRPNLIFVFSDQHRRQAMGFMDRDPVQTPNFDRFARESLVFDNAISAFPLCAPYRAMTFTGRSPFSNGVLWNGACLKPDVKTIFQVLQENGYHTGYVGKWHLAGLYKKPWVAGNNRYYKWKRSAEHDQSYWMREWAPREQRPFFDFWHANECFNDMFRLNYFEEDPDRPILGRCWQPEHETQVAMDYIKQRQAQDQPFALFLSWNPPHPGNKFLDQQPMETPTGAKTWPKPKTADPGYYAPDEYKKLYAALKHTGSPSFKPHRGEEDITQHLSGYYGAVTAIDHSFGQLMQFLQHTGLEENTIVVYTSDHGDMMGSHGQISKRLWFEESIGVPFMIRWPHRIRTGTESMTFSNLHIMPTLLGLMGLPVPRAVEGTDYSPTLTGSSTERPSAELIQYVCTFRREQPDSTDYIPHNAKSYILAHGAWRGIRTPQHCYVTRIFAGRTIRYLYDLHNDPYQMDPQRSVGTPTTPMMPYEQQLHQKLAQTNDPFLPWITGAQEIPDCLKAANPHYQLS